MLIKKLSKIINTDHDVDWGNGRSRRFLLESDGFPFTITETTVKAGTESKLQYLNHAEACYCVEGEGEVESDGESTKLSQGLFMFQKKISMFFEQKIKI